MMLEETDSEGYGYSKPLKENSFLLFRYLEESKRRLEEVYEISMREDRNCSISSGGLKASTIWDKGQVVCLELDFVLESWEESIDDE